MIVVHKKHVSKLEAALRCLDNDALEAEDLDPIRDGLDYYLVSLRLTGSLCAVGGGCRLVCCGWVVSPLLVLWEHKPRAQRVTE